MFKDKFLIERNKDQPFLAFFFDPASSKRLRTSAFLASRSAALRLASWIVIKLFIDLSSF